MKNILLMAMMLSSYLPDGEREYEVEGSSYVTTKNKVTVMRANEQFVNRC